MSQQQVIERNIREPPLEVREIESVTFGILSPEEILRQSVCEINNGRKSGPGTVYDPKMGTTDSNEKCKTCGQGAHGCPGHFGRIAFHQPIIHPLYIKRVLAFLNCFCLKCYRLLLTKEQVGLHMLNRYRADSRFVRIQAQLKKVDICCHCGMDQPTCKETDKVIYMTYEGKDKSRTQIAITTDEIAKIFDNISDSDVRLIGFDPTLVHPRNFIISYLPVLPPCDRPHVKSDGNTCDDDLTNQYVEIIKANNNLAPKEVRGRERAKDRGASETKRQKDLASLRFRVLTMFNNTGGRAKHTTNGRPIKGIKERLGGKDGQLRNNMMGKRCNQTARTVIGPDPTLKLGELAVPDAIADILTVPVPVATFNRDLLQKLVNSGQVNSLLKPDGVTRINLTRFRRGTRLIAGDIIHRDGNKIKVINGRELVQEGDRVERAGKFLEKLAHANRSYPLKLGWIVERRLQDGDYVLLNRQPTLHKASMQAMKVIRRPGKTFRFNLAITRPFNADFDGDEMNVHAPQTIEARAELEELSAAKWNLISAQSGKPNMAIVQDSLLAAYRMTQVPPPGQNPERLTEGQFYDISMRLELDEPIKVRIQHIYRVLRKMGKKVQCWNGKGLFSLFLPKDLCYEKKNDGSPQEPVVRIYRGVLYEGTLNKAILGPSHNSLIQIINKEYGPSVAAHFIDCVQFVTNGWLLIHGFTVGLGDCLVANPSSVTQIKGIVTKCIYEAEGIKSTTSHPLIRETRVTAALNKAKDLGLKIAREALTSNNNFLSTVRSGSKGDFFNIAQITGLLGQQNLKGKRVPLMLNHRRRTLPHYPFDISSPEMEYESRGFVSSSFIHGLNPREFYFHAMTGREGISDTAMGTATSGYMQRRIIKLMEDTMARYDGTVRDAAGHIYQMAYGQDGLDPTKTVKVNGVQEACDVSRLITRLNLEYSLGLKRKRKQSGQVQTTLPKRLITKAEIETVLEFIKPQRGIPPETAQSVVNRNKARLRKQLSEGVVYPALLPVLKNRLEEEFRAAKVQPGESVGVICAQSIGEKQTQNTLNTFHRAGISEKTQTQGVPRFAEIINATRKPRIVNHTVYFHEKASGVEELREMVGSSIMGLTLKDLSTKTTVRLDAQPEPWYAIFETLNQSKYEKWNAEHEVFPEHCVSFHLNVDQLFEIKLDMKEIAQIIESEYSDLFCVYSPPQLGRFDVFVDVSVITLPEDRVLFVDADNAHEVFLEELALPQLEQVSICGIPGITEIFFAKDKGEWFVDTQGINSRTIKTNYLNYKALLACSIVDATRTLSNNVWDIYEVLGIEAARQFLIEELLSIMDGVNPCHIDLLVDRMTHGGAIASITRYTMKKEDSGVFSKCSFEETMDHFLDAAARGELEPTRGVSASIVCGKRSSVGTGMVQLLMDLTRLPKSKPKPRLLPATTIGGRGQVSQEPVLECPLPSFQIPEEEDDEPVFLEL